MPKRKANDVPSEAPPSTRRRTRSSDSAAMQLDSEPRKKRGRPPGLPASKIQRSTDDRGSSKENDKSKDHQSSDDASGDELNMLPASPSKAKTRHVTPEASSASIGGKRTPRTRGQIMEVVITTPKSTGRTLRSHSTFVAGGSPSPSRPPRTTARASVLTHSGDKRVHELPDPNSRGSPALSPFHSSTRTSPTLANTTSPLRTVISPYKQPVASQPLPRPLPSYLLSHFHSQKRAVLHALQHPPLLAEDNDKPFRSVLNQLTELLKGTTERSEGNSCLILGPRGSGKSRLVDRALASLPSTSATPTVVVRLSAHCQANDRLAMREVARQVHQQVGSASSLALLHRNDEGQEISAEPDDSGVELDLPPPSHLPALISALPALGRPVVVVLDGFDGFAAHARQALLYCLLDTVQSCRGGATSVKADEVIVPLINPAGSQDEDEGNAALVKDDTVAGDKHEAQADAANRAEHGLLVIGVTSRVDCLTLLEKRVKSRFSHRVMRVRTPVTVDDFSKFIQGVLNVDMESEGDAPEEWKRLWTMSVDNFLGDKTVLGALKETFAFGKDLRALFRLLTSPVIALTSSSPWLTATQLTSSLSIQRCPKRFPFLLTLPYPHMALLIAAAHARAAGHDTFNFEMLFDTFMAQVRMSASAPVQLEGGAIGMVKVGRGVMIRAFEHLTVTHVFQPVAAPSTHVTKEFTRYRCIAEREDIRAAVEYLGQTNLKKWFSKPK